MRKARRQANSDTGVTRVIGYVRVSTDKQTQSGLGLEAQKQKLESECERRGWQLVRIAVDEGKSAKDMNRPNLQTVLAELAAGQADVLMFSKQDRFSRSVRDVANWIEMSQHYGWRLVDLEMDIDTTTPMGEMMAIQRAAASQWERRMIGVRTKEALAAKKAQGFTLGRPVEIPANVESMILALRQKGLSMQKIAEQLNSEAVETARGGKWHAVTVQKVLRRHEQVAA